MVCFCGDKCYREKVSKGTGVCVSVRVCVCVVGFCSFKWDSSERFQWERDIDICI